MSMRFPEAKFLGVLLVGVVFTVTGCASSGVVIPRTRAAQDAKSECDARYDTCSHYQDDTYCKRRRRRCYGDIPGAHVSLAPVPGHRA